MLKIDYEATYKARPLNDSVIAARRALLSAQEKMSQAESGYRAGIARILCKDIEDLEFTNSGCMADGIPSCVYNTAAQHGVGHRKCYFCGCDDFDGI